MDSIKSRNTLAAEAGLAAAAMATAATYSIRAIHPWPHSPLNAFLATFGHANAAVWPAQVVGRNLASVVGAAFLCYALVGYPLIGMPGGHSLRTLPVIGLSTCATVVFFFGLLLRARPPAPGYVMLVPLAWALGAAPPDLARGVAADYGMLAAGLIIWRDRASWPAGQTLAAGLLLALMIGWSGHEDVLNGIALVALAVTATLAIRAGRRLPRARPAAPARQRPPGPAS